jgi:hypothetical protein
MLCDAKTLSISHFLLRPGTDSGSVDNPVQFINIAACLPKHESIPWDVNVQASAGEWEQPE